MSDNGFSSWTSKLPVGAIAVAFLVTLAIWLFFYFLQMPLQPAATTVVAAVALGGVVFARWLWSHFRGRAGKP